MGMSEPLDALVAVDLEACRPDPACRFDARVELPLEQVMPALRRLEATTDSILWLEVDATLVRTFAGGTWLQTLPLGGSTREGRLGDIVRVSGIVSQMGLFPAADALPIGAGDGLFTEPFDWAASVERRRRDIGDRSRPMPMADGTLRVAFAPACPTDAGITMHTDAGDVALDVRDIKAGQPEVRRAFSIPIDTTFRLSVHDGWGIDYGMRGGWGMRVLDVIRSSGEPLALEVTVDCARALIQPTEAPPDDRRPVRPGTNGRSP